MWVFNNAMPLLFLLSLVIWWSSSSSVYLNLPASAWSVPQKRASLLASSPCSDVLQWATSGILQSVWLFDGSSSPSWAVPFEHYFIWKCYLTVSGVFESWVFCSRIKISSHLLYMHFVFDQYFKYHSSYFLFGILDLSVILILSSMRSLISSIINRLTALSGHFSKNGQKVNI